MFDQRCFIYLSSICYDAYGVNDGIQFTTPYHAYVSKWYNQPNMQPNDQNQQPPASQPAQNGYVSPSGAAVPEYLHMEAVVDPVAAARRKKRRRFIISLSIISPILLAGVGFLGYWVWLQNTPQEKFYQALNEQMRISYVKRSIDTTIGGGSATTIVSTDASDPVRTKSSILTTMNTASKASLSMQTIVLNSERYAVLVKSMSSGSAPGGLEINQWYDAPFHAAKRKEIDYWINNVQSPLVLNSVQGIIPTGNFTASQSDQLLDYVRQHDTYHVQGVQTQMENGVKLTGYNVELDIDKVNSLNGEIVKLLGLPQLFTIQKPYPVYQEVVFWVNETTGRLAKIVYSSGTAKDAIDMKQVTRLDYPDKLLINAPSGAKELSS